MQGEAMTDPATLLALADRCEQAAGPDAGLDLAIWKALSEMPGFKHPSPIWRFDVTESLDAAVTLYLVLPEVISSCPRKASAAALRARAAMS
jgi:hypothetical protein